MYSVFVFYLIVVDGGGTAQLEATVDSGDVFTSPSEQSTEAGPSNIDKSLSGATQGIILFDYFLLDLFICLCRKFTL